jgi:cytochrome c oxidase subunit 5b
MHENVFWRNVDIGRSDEPRDNVPPANPTPTAEITNEHDLLPPTGAAPGTMPTDLEQSTGLERLEILGKMQGVDIFDLSPLDASRKGTYTVMG